MFCHLLPALSLFSCLVLAKTKDNHTSSNPTSSDESSNLPPSYQLLVGGQPGPFYTFNYDVSQKTITNVSKTVELGTGPSWVGFDQSKKFMFSSDATKNFRGLNNMGGVFSSSIDKDGKITVISSSATAIQPVRVAVERFTIDPKTRALSSQPAQTIYCVGQSVNPKRQTKAYIHDVQYTPDYSQVVAVDLGSDLIRKFKVDKDGKLTKIQSVKLPPGCGPRHLAWGPRADAKLDAYVICSLTRVLLTFEVDITSDYKFTLKGKSLSTEPIKPLNSTTLEGSEILLSPDGRFVVTSTTQTSHDEAHLPDNLLVSFARDLKTGLLDSKPIRIPTGGRVPRQFSFDPTGQLIAVAQQGAGNVVVFERNVKTGEAKMVTQVPAEKASFAMWRSVEN
ncbi:Lactonase, 7-bladed beta-propeller-domain-containing protein [Melampsora americana]|nr:Lactonase, 7-bladed beta-propeller-domain-containing protein [Melampsora americana]